MHSCTSEHGICAPYTGAMEPACTSPALAPAILLAAGQFGRIMGAWATRRVGAHAHGEIQVSFNVGDVAVDYRLDGRTERIHPKHALVIPSWAIHERLVDRNSASFVLVLALSPSWLAGKNPEAQVLKGLAGSVTLQDGLVELLGRIRTAFEVVAGESVAESHPLIMELIGQLGQLGGGKPQAH